MVYLCLACVLGIIVGVFVPVIPYEYAKYTAVAIMAAFDSVVGATNGILKNNFDIKIFVSGFFTNSVIAILLTMLGENLDVDIFLAAIFVFVSRIFTNLSCIRRDLLKRYEKRKLEAKKRQSVSIQK